jgi:hypothetical protein
MSDFDWILDRLGDPIPCALCGKLTPPEDLAEGVIPGTVVAEWSMVVFRVVSLCPACPDLST